MKVTRCEFVHNLPCEQVSSRLTELEAEDAKLRELIKDLQVAPCCGEHCWMKLSDRMRELGIEVDDA